jgi:nicotinamide mononucleotide (NMN) deamidase PncC
MFDRRILTADSQPEFVAAAARTVRELAASHYGLAIGGFPASDDDHTPPGDVYIGLATPSGVRIGKYPFAGHPDVVGPRTVKLALNMLRLCLLERSP